MRYATLLATWTLVHFAWQGALLGAAFVAWRRLGRPASAERRYRASLAFLLALAAAVPATAVALHRALVRDATVAIAGTGLFGRPASVPLAGGALPLGDAAPALVATGGTWLLALWAIGCTVALARLGIAWRRERRLACGATAGAPALRRRVAELAARLGVGTPVRIVVPHGGRSPYVTGGRRRATLVLPAPVLRALRPDEADAVLLHELAHVRRRDHAANALQHLVESALWFHPAVWLVSRAASEERERCCDRLAVRAGGDARALARALARLAVQEPPRLRHAALAFAEQRSGIVGRVHELMRQGDAPAERAREQRLLETGGVALAMLLLATAVVIPAPERTLWEAGSLAAAIPTRATTVDGVDPAGRFRLHFVNGVPRAAELDGRRYGRARLERDGDVLRVRGDGGAMLLAVTLEENGIRWEPRRSR